MIDMESEKDGSTLEFVKDEVCRIINAIPTGIIEIVRAKEYGLLFANDWIINKLGYTRLDFDSLVKGSFGFVHPEDRICVKETLDTQWRSGQALEVEFRVVTKQEQIIWVHAIGKKVESSRDYPVFQFNITDITKNWMTTHQLELEKNRYESIFNLSDSITLEYDFETGRIIFSDNLQAYFDIESTTFENHANIIEQGIKNISKNPEEIFTYICEVKERNRVYVLESLVKIKTGEYQWFRIKSKGVFVGQKQVGLLGKIINIHKEKKEQELLLHEAHYDSLTGLLNKKMIQSTITDCIQNKPDQLYAMTIIDLDNFKLVNDTYGHMFGDVVLREFAKLLIEKKSKLGMCSIGRIGGDEFLLFSSCESVEEAKAAIYGRVERLKYVFFDKYKIDDFACSVGTSFYPQNGVRYDELFEKADRALYHAKCNGKGKGAFFVDEMGDIPGYQVFETEKEYGRKYDLQYQALFSRDIAVFAFDILSNTKDTIAAIRIILERLAREMNIQCFHIVENLSDMDAGNLENLGLNQYYATFQWDNKGWEPGGRFKELGESRKIAYPLNRELVEFDNKDGIFEVENCIEYKDNSYFRRLFRWMDAKAMLGCAMREMGQFKGCICLYDTEHNRKWSDYEKSSLLIVTKLVTSYMAMFRTNRMAENKIEKLTNYDKLTGLCKSEKFNLKVKEILSRARADEKYALMYSDISNFKYLNDMLGYEMGNNVLRQYARMLLKGEYVVCGCRIHSDHFVALLKYTAHQNISEIVLTFNSNCKKTLERSFPNSSINFCTGVYGFKDNKDNILEALDNVNMARKEEKRNPLNGCQLFDERLKSQRKRFGEIEATMHRALERGEFQVYIQPKYHLETSAVIGGEALIRWIKADGTVYYPDEFIPIFENNGFIEELDFFVLDKVCSKLSEFRSKGKKMMAISVNQSRYLLSSPNYVDRVKSVIEKYQIPPEYIELELTETMVLNNTEKVIEILNKLKMFGVLLSIDDFGTGYSSLNILKILPVDVIKLDRTFLDETSQSSTSRVIIESIVILAKKLGMMTICEGIETLEQADFLRSIDCHFVQGFLFSRPIPLLEYEKILVQG